MALNSGVNRGDGYTNGSNSPPYSQSYDGSGVRYEGGSNGSSSSSSPGSGSYSPTHTGSPTVTGPPTVNGYSQVRTVHCVLCVCPIYYTLLYTYTHFPPHNLSLVNITFPICPPVAHTYTHTLTPSHPHTITHTHRSLPSQVAHQAPTPFLTDL